ncbi:Replication factor A protein 1 [Orobanche hederae]
MEDIMLAKGMTENALENAINNGAAGNGPDSAAVGSCSNIRSISAGKDGGETPVTGNRLNNRSMVGRRYGSNAITSSRQVPDNAISTNPPNPPLFLDELRVGMSGSITVMVCRMWDVQNVKAKYLSTDFIVSDSKGQAIHCTVRASVAHNFLRIKEGLIYTFNNFIVRNNVDEYRVRKDDIYMLEFDGQTTFRKVLINTTGFERYPLVLGDFETIDDTNNSFCIDVIGYIMSVDRIKNHASGKRSLDIRITNQSGQAMKVTLWGGLCDVLIEKKIKHSGICPILITSTVARTYHNKLSLSSTSSTAIFDDDSIPVIKQYREEQGNIELTEGTWEAPSGERCATIENLLMWSRNRKNDPTTFHTKVTIEDVMTRKGWSYPSCGGGKCKRSATRKNGRWFCEACKKYIDYPVLKYRLELGVADETGHVVVIMFDETTQSLVKCSAESLMSMHEEGPEEEESVPIAISNLIGTTHTLELKTHTYFEVGTFESFTCWKVVQDPVVEETGSSNSCSMEPRQNSGYKRLRRHPSISTPSKPDEGRKHRNLKIDDSDVEESYYSHSQQKGKEKAKDCEIPTDFDDLDDTNVGENNDVHLDSNKKFHTHPMMPPLSNPPELLGAMEIKPVNMYSSASESELFWNDLDVGVTGTLILMLCRSWDINAPNGCYISTDFIVSDAKGGVMHCTAKTAVSHNFIKLKEGSIYSVRNFQVQNKENEYRILKNERFKLEFDGATIVREVYVSNSGFVRYPFQFVDIPDLALTSSNSTIDVVGFVKDVRQITTKLNGATTLDFKLENTMGHSVRVTLWNVLGENLIRKRTCRFGVYAAVLTCMIPRIYNRKLYISSSSSTVILDDDAIPAIDTLMGGNSRAIMSRETLSMDCTQPRPATLENLLMWARNLKHQTATFQCGVRINNVRTQGGWNYQHCGGTNCMKGFTSEGGMFYCESCEGTVHYPVLRYRLELEVSDTTAEAVIVLYDETAKDLIKHSADSIVGSDDGALPQALASIVGTNMIFELKSHTYYEHDNFESFTCCKIISPTNRHEEQTDSNEPTNRHEEQTDSNEYDPPPASTSLKMLIKEPKLDTPSKPPNEKKHIRFDSEDSDEEVTSKRRFTQTLYF